MIVYIDENYVCHADSAADRRPFEVASLDGLCSLMVETYRFIPFGEAWVRTDGVAFHGESLLPAADTRPFEVAQVQHEIDEATHLEELGALIEEIYNEDMEVIG